MCLYETLKVYPSELDARIAYFQTLDNHLIHINQAFDCYGKRFAEALKVDIRQVAGLIEVHDQSKKTSGEEIAGYLAEYYPYTGDNMPTSSYGLRRTVFEKGILKHYQANKHHSEYWVSVDRTNNKMVTAPMEDIYIIEMVLDWIGHGEEIGHLDVVQYWTEKRGMKFIHPITIPKIDRLVGIVEASPV